MGKTGNLRKVLSDHRELQSLLLSARGAWGSVVVKALRC